MSDTMYKSKEAIEIALATLAKHPHPPHDPQLAIAIVEKLAKLPRDVTIDATCAEYSYGAKLFENGVWYHPNGAAHPPGTSFLGVVLDKALEVSVVESLDSSKIYHRPMAMLYPGALFGLFEFADFQCGTLCQQDYTVFAGARTFFFSDPQLSEGCDTVIAGALATLTGKHEPFTLRLSGSYNKIIEQRRYHIPLARFSPTQLPLMTLQALLGDSIDWNTKILLVPISNRLLIHLGDELVQRLFSEAWTQSAHLRRTAIGAYRSDEVLEKTHDSVNKRIHAGVGKEIQALMLVTVDGRPGFSRLSGPCRDTYGPFEAFFAKLRDLQTKGRKDYHSKAHAGNEEFVNATIEDSVFVPTFRFDQASGDVVVPVFPNCYPSYDGTGAREKEAGSAPVQEHANTWFASDGEPYMADSVKWIGASSKDGHKKKVTFLRTYAAVSPLPARLPTFKEVEGKLDHVMGVVAVQHLMEETVCLVHELIAFRGVDPKSIWIFGKPYSSNYRVAYRLLSIGVNVVLAEPAWDPGGFDAWFSNRIEQFFEDAVTDLIRRKRGSNLALLLDDGGALIRAASTSKKFKGVRFAAVEQTSRGMNAAKDASKRFCVVPVACCALKSVVEPEFVARAAVAKIAKSYPEALSPTKVGVVGLGNIGRYLCDYLVRRPDIAVSSVLGFDRDRARSSGLPKGVTWVSRFGDLWQRNDVNVLFGCTGTDLTPLLNANKPSGSVLCISLSSGDIEFAGILRKAAKRLKKSPTYDPYGLVQEGMFLIATGGFPVTFDRESVSAPVFEMQMTRALLLAGLIEAANAQERNGLRKLPHEVQWKIWNCWRSEASDVLVKSHIIHCWQRQREKEMLNPLSDLVASEDWLQERNDALFRDRGS